MRQGEDHVDVSHGQKFILTSRDPVVASPALTLGTVAIATAVIGDGAIATARTQVAMPAQCRGAATCDGVQHFPVGPVDPAAVALDEAIALCAAGSFFLPSPGTMDAVETGDFQGIEGIGEGLQLLGRQMQVDQGVLQSGMSE